MTKTERVLAAIKGQAVDKIPMGEFHLEDGLTAGLLQAAAQPTEEIDINAKIKACELLGLDALVFMPDNKRAGNEWEMLKRWHKQSDFFLFALIDGPFQGVYHQYEDFIDFLMDTKRNKEKITEMAQTVCQKSIELGQAALEAGAHGILIADDIAFNQGLYVSPTTMREMFFPYTKELIDTLVDCTDAGRESIPIFFHSDGNLLQILKDLQVLGFAGIHSLEPVMDMREVREIVGPDMCLMGGYDLGWFRSEGVAKADELLKAAMPGRYIFGSSAGILDSTLPAAEVLKVYRFVEETSR